MSISTCQKDYKGKREKQPVAFLGNHSTCSLWSSNQKHNESTRHRRGIKPKGEEAVIALPPKGGWWDIIPTTNHP